MAGTSWRRGKSRDSTGILHFPKCAGCGWGRVSFPHSSWWWAVFWICPESRIDTVKMFLLCFHSIQLFSASHPAQWGGRGCTRTWGHRMAGIIPDIWLHAQGTKLGKRRGKVGHSGGAVCPPKPVTEPCFPGMDKHLPACVRWGTKSLFGCACTRGF